MIPADVAVSKTSQFVCPHCLRRPPGRCAYFEVGCGTGSLAARLAEAGYQVLALDSSPKAV